MNRNEQWLKYYELAKKYFEYHGNLIIPQNFVTKNGYEYDADGMKLGMWLNGQRERYNKGEMGKQKIELLSFFQENFTMSNNDQIWMKNYELAKIYYEHYCNLKIHHLFITNNGYEYDKDGTKLGHWIANKRVNFSKGKLSDKKIELLKEIGMIFNNVRENEWNNNYELAKAYYEHFGNIRIPTRFKTKNGYEYDDNGYKLGEWLHTQKHYCREGIIDEERKLLLKEIGVIVKFGTKTRWEHNYELAKAYYEHHGNLLIHRDFKTNNGYEYNEHGFSLGKWLHTQRFLYSKKKLDKKYEELLKQIGMKFVLLDRSAGWDKYYKLAKLYFEYHQNLDVPVKFKTLNGYEYDESGEALGSWVNRQKNLYKNGKLSEDRKKQLEDIGMYYDGNYKRFEEICELVKIYFEHYGDYNIPQQFKTNNGYEYDENGFSLGQWLNNQKISYKYQSLSEKRIKKLEEIGIDFLIGFQQKYELAKIYFSYYGNLMVPVNFKTTDGINYDENGINLAIWVINLRQRFKKQTLSTEKYNCLNNIGMVWELRRKLKEIHNICSQYNIDIEINKNVLESISYSELVSKINYLNEIGSPICDNEGVLHEIFSMCNVNMEIKYGIDLNGLITNYFLKEKKRKRG